MMRNRILSPSTYNQRLCAIHAFFDYVMTEEPAYMEQCIRNVLGLHGFAQVCQKISLKHPTELLPLQADCLTQNCVMGTGFHDY